MSNNANRLEKLSAIAKILDPCDSDEASAILNAYATLRGLQVGGCRSTTSTPLKETRPRSSSRRSTEEVKRKSDVKLKHSKAAVRESRERELGMTAGQVLDIKTRLLDIQKEFKGKGDAEAAKVAHRYGLDPSTARQLVGRTVQTCQDLSTWLNGKPWFDRSTGKRVDTMPRLTDSFRRLLGDEGSCSGINSQNEAV